MAIRIGPRDVSIDWVGNRWLNEPGLVLAGYALLALMTLVAPGSILQAGVAGVLVLFGPGYSLVAVLFPVPASLGGVERMALAGGLSLAVGGIAGLLLARSPWGLHPAPLMLIMALFSFGCYLLVLWRRRDLAPEDIPFRSFRLPTLDMWWRREPRSGRVVAVLLAVFLISGAGALNQAILAPAEDPSMTEFFLVDAAGKAQDYPKEGRVGGPLPVNFGISNREADPVVYSIQALIGDVPVGGMQPIKLDPDEVHRGEMKLHIPTNVSGNTKIDFVLYRGDAPYRSLHLWLDIQGAAASAVAQ